MGDSGTVLIPIPIPLKPLIPTPIPIPAFPIDLIPIPIPKWIKISVIPESIPIPIPIPESESPTLIWSGLQ